MRLVPMVSVAALFTPVGGASGAQDPSRQDTTARITDVRHVRWVWKAEFELGAPAHVVIVDWHPALGLERRYPRRPFATQALDAGRHTVAGDPSPVRIRARFGGPAWGLVGSRGAPVFVSSRHGSLNVGPSSPALRRLILGSGDPHRFTSADGSAGWRAFVLTLPHGVSSAEVDSVIREVAFTGAVVADLAALAAALGATAWGGQPPQVRRPREP